MTSSDQLLVHTSAGEKIRNAIVLPSIEPYEPARHYEMIKSWVLQRNVCSILPPEFFPQVGFVSPGLAAGFLYQTDSALGLVEGLFSNPNSNPSDRGLALNKIIEAIIEKAKMLGIKNLFAMSELRSVKKRCLLFGMAPVCQNMTLFSREI